jgi:hypothetical protein
MAKWYLAIKSTQRIKPFVSEKQLIYEYGIKKMLFRPHLLLFINNWNGNE